MRSGMRSPIPTASESTADKQSSCEHSALQDFFLQSAINFSSFSILFSFSFSILSLSLELSSSYFICFKSKLQISTHLFVISQQ